MKLLWRCDLEELRVTPGEDSSCISSMSLNCSSSLSLRWLERDELRLIAGEESLRLSCDGLRSTLYAELLRESCEGLRDTLSEASSSSSHVAPALSSCGTADPSGE